VRPAQGHPSLDRAGAASRAAAPTGRASIRFRGGGLGRHPLVSRARGCG
jgi:hypothetical protein